MDDEPQHLFVLIGALFDEGHILIGGTVCCSLAGAKLLSLLFCFSNSLDCGAFGVSCIDKCGLFFEVLFLRPLFASLSQCCSQVRVQKLAETTKQTFR